MANNDWYRALSALGMLMQTPGVFQEYKRQMDEEGKIKKYAEAKQYRQENPSLFNIGNLPREASPANPFRIGTPPVYTPPLKITHTLPPDYKPKKFTSNTSMGDLSPEVFKLMQKDPQVLLQFFGHDNAPATFHAAQDLGFLPQPQKGDGSSVQYYDVTLPDGKKVKVTGNEYLSWYNKQNNTALTASDYDSILQVMRAKFPKLALGLNWDEQLTEEYGDFDTIFKAIGKSLYPHKFVTNKPQSGMDYNNQIPPEDEDVF